MQLLTLHFIFFSPCYFFSRFSFPCVFFLTNSHVFKILCYSKLLVSYIVTVNNFLHTVSHSLKRNEGYLENVLVKIANYYIPYGMHKIKLDYKILYL